MKLFFILIFLFIIIAPFIYFQHYFHSINKLTKMIFSFLSLLTLFVTLIKIYFHPNSPFFFILTLILQYYMLSLFVSMILLIIYQFICRCLHKQVIQKISIILIVISISFVSIGYITHFHKVKEPYQITIHKESSLDYLHIAFVSDMHLGSGTYLNDVKNFVDAMNKNDYDLVCFGGDLFDETTPKEMIPEALALLSQIDSRYGMYAVNGNHEHYAQFLDQQAYKKNNIHLLSENYVCVNGLFNIVGREDVSAKSHITYQQVIQNMDTSLPTIVLDHNPKRYQEVMSESDLQLSGHTHAGQAFPLSLATAPLYDNDYGLLLKNDFSLIVTSGYGSWGFPVRFMTQCEFVMI